MLLLFLILSVELAAGGLCVFGSFHGDPKYKKLCNLGGLAFVLGTFLSIVIWTLRNHQELIHGYT